MVSGEVANSRIDRQTNRQTDKRRVKYNLFGGGKKAKSESLGKLRLFLNNCDAVLTMESDTPPPESGFWLLVGVGVSHLKETPYLSYLDFCVI